MSARCISLTSAPSAWLKPKVMATTGSLALKSRATTTKSNSISLALCAVRGQQYLHMGADGAGRLVV
eukprot:224717-Rhodomonas_salina.1